VPPADLVDFSGEVLDRIPGAERLSSKELELQPVQPVLGPSGYEADDTLALAVQIILYQV
jgi:hypothetical protein